MNKTSGITLRKNYRHTMHVYDPTQRRATGDEHAKSRKGTQSPRSRQPGEEKNPSIYKLEDGPLEATRVASTGVFPSLF